MARNLVLASLIFTCLAFVASALYWPGVVQAKSDSAQGLGPPTPAPWDRPMLAASAAPLASEELDSDVMLEVLALKRRGPAVQMKIAIVNESDEDVHPGTYGLAHVWKDVYGTAQWHYELSTISLIDFDGGKKYKVIRDSKDKCSCSQGLLTKAVVKPGKRKTFFASFAAPPLEVETITIEFEGAPPVDDVPIAQ